MPIREYTRSPQTIQAERFNGSDIPEIIDRTVYAVGLHFRPDGGAMIEWRQNVSPGEQWSALKGDYIIRDNGGYVVLTEDEFRAQYTPVGGGQEG